MRREGFDSTVAVPLYQKCFYVSPVTEIPTLEGKPIVDSKINKKGGVQMAFAAEESDMALLWENVMAVAGWPS